MTIKERKLNDNLHLKRKKERINEKGRKFKNQDSNDRRNK